MIILLLLMFGYDKSPQEIIQKIIQGTDELKRSNRIASINAEPFQMENGREIELNLANIIIGDPLNPRAHIRDSNKYVDPNYLYLTSKKTEELAFDRLEQLKRATQNMPELYSLETYFEQYESQIGNKISELEKQRIKKFDGKIQRDLILGKYNLEDYITFLKSIPDLLSQKKFLAIGRFDDYGTFWKKDEIYKTPSPDDISQYSAYAEHISKGQEDNYRVIASPSIQRRMSNKYKLYALTLNENEFFRPKMPEKVKENPNIIYVGSNIDSNFRIYSDENGILFAGEYLPTIPAKPEGSSNEIDTNLEEISR